MEWFWRCKWLQMAEEGKEDILTKSRRADLADLST